MIIPAPRPITDLRYGDTLVAGLGVSTILAEMDYETYSEAGFYWDNDAGKWLGPPGAPGSDRDDKGLPVVGAANYVKHPTCEVNRCAYDLKDGRGRRRWRPGQPNPQDLFDFVARGGIVEAFNAPFERWVWSEVCEKRYGWPPCPPIEQWRCAVAKCRAHALPGSLGDVGKVLDVDVKKDDEGTRLIKKFTMPQKPTRLDPRTRHDLLDTQQDVDETLALLLDRPDLKPADVRKIRERVAEDIADSARFADYNETDIEAEAHVSALVPDLSPDELTFWIDDQRINRRGVQIDVKAMHDCCAVLDQAIVKYGIEMRQLTGCAPTEVSKIIGWLRAFGVHTDSLDEEAVEGLLKQRAVLPAPVVRALEIRAAVGSASVKKVYSMRARVTAEGRLHDMYLFHGAHTGRPTGDGVQSTNLPKAGPMVYRCECGRWHGSHTMTCPWCNRLTIRGPKAAEEWNPPAVKDALAVIATRRLDVVEHYFGPALKTIAGCLRGLFIAKPGHVLVSSDFTAIEGVVVACLAGEQWRIDAYANDEPMYLLSAERMFGVSVAEMKEYAKVHGKHHPLRQKGKGGELACLAGDARVLTRRGYVPLLDVELSDQLWDGEGWVNHAGVVTRGLRETVDLGGLRMTPDHQVLCGTFWREAGRLVSHGSTRRQALATGSVNLPFWAWPSPATTRASWFSARVARRRTPSSSQVFAAGLARDAKPAACAQPRNLAGSAWGITSLSLTKRTASGYCPAFLPRSLAAAGPAIRSGPTTGVGASLFTSSGAKIVRRFWPMWSRFKGGTTQALKWIASTWTKVTSQATSASSAAKTTHSTSGPSKRCNDGSTSLRAVYDIADAGPRNRFTVLTGDGPIIVHNCGFGGWISSLRQFGVDGPDDELKDVVLKWRKASPNVEWFWGGQTKGAADAIRQNAGLIKYADRWDRTPYLFGLEGMMVKAIQNPGTECPVLRMDGTPTGISYLMRGDVLYCRVPSGGLLTYHRPRLRPAAQDWRGLSISYEGWNTNPKNGPYGWITKAIYGGRACENVVQKVARDIQMNAIHRLEQAGLPVVMHTYDEDVCEVPIGRVTVPEIEAIMTQPLPWTQGWPIKAAGGWIDDRYCKA